MRRDGDGLQWLRGQISNYSVERFKLSSFSCLKSDSLRHNKSEKRLNLFISKDTCKDTEERIKVICELHFLLKSTIFTKDSCSMLGFFQVPYFQLRRGKQSFSLIAQLFKYLCLIWKSANIFSLNGSLEKFLQFLLYLSAELVSCGLVHSGLAHCGKLKRKETPS